MTALDVAALVVVLVGGRATLLRADEKTPAVESGSPASAYADQDVCVTCHPEQAEAYAKTPHAAALAGEDRPLALRGCQACHGPGAAHAEAGGGKGVGGLRTFSSTERASDRSAKCLECHAGRESLHDFKASEHALAAVPCTGCHRMHGGTRDRLLAKAPPELCYGCHLEIRAKFALPEHHRVNEGVVGCLDCHQPHGTRTRAALRAANDRTCFRCHGEIEGPFVFEHAGLVVEGCARCHDPHGSVDRHLLVRQQVAQLCYECHTVTPSNHLQPSYRDCTRCHVDIHGSNTDRRFLEQ
jgi:DmsE family decaheme c-type cytochrome